VTRDAHDAPDGDVATYTPAGPSRPTAEELRGRIPGWGADLDPQDRPSYPKLQLQPDLTGAHWRFPERQAEHRPRERSIEHRFLTPVFGTAQPTRGLSGEVRKLAYARWSEGRNAHWLALMAADRIDVLESAVASLLKGKPDNILAETGVKAELTHHGLSSRFGQKRSDWRHHALDPFIVLGPWLLAAWVAQAVVRRLLR
jgi:hypothetical protein